MKRLKEAWLSYAAQVIPPTAPAVQRVECRRAFYAGAHAIFQELMRGLDPGTEPTARDLARVDMLDQELRAFQADVAGGRA